MDEFQPGLSFIPVCRAEITLRLHGQAYSTRAEARHSSAKYNLKNMPGKTNFLTISALMFLQSGLLLLLILQLQGIVIIYKLAEMKRNLLLSSYFAAKKTTCDEKENIFKHVV